MAGKHEHALSRRNAIQCDLVLCAMRCCVRCCDAMQEGKAAAAGLQEEMEARAA